MREILARSVWAGLLVWVGLYSCDYLLTQLTARLYHSRAKQMIVPEGSFELNPLLERDVDSLRLLSPRFAAAPSSIPF